MANLNQKYLFIFITVFLLLLSLSQSYGLSSQTDVSNERIKIASFNIQVFGKSKASKPNVIKVLAAITTEFDMVAIQEIRDKTGIAVKILRLAIESLGKDYKYIIGPRLGRTKSREQYLYIYDTRTIEMIGSYTHNDISDEFHRQPFVAYFKARNGNFDFLLINIHTDPDEATKEIRALPKVITYAQELFGEDDIILLGDFNSDCGYFEESTYEIIFPADKYGWLIKNNEDTTVKGTNCTYDRIVITASANEDYAGSSSVYVFDAAFDLTEKQASKVSDHYPVWAEFYIDKDND